MNEAKSPRREMLLVNGREIPVAVVRSRRARRYVLRLRADGLARLTIPRNGSAREAWEFAQRQGPWLERQLADIASRPIRPKEWRIGTEILFRGELTKIETVSHSRFAIDRWDNFIVQSTKPTANNSPSPGGEGRGEGGCQTDFFAGISSAHKAGLIRLGDQSISITDITADLRPAIESHLRAMAGKELPALTLDFAAMHQLSVRRVTVRAQRSRWGSCSFKGVISLNWRLIQTPRFVRDYIILHELMHLRQMNHSARFWKEVERVCPDYKRAKLWLKENPGLLDR